MTCVGFGVLHHPGTHAFTWPDFAYEYDRVGNISKMVTSSSVGVDTQSFDYDHLNRLWKAVATGGVANYTHNTANTDFEYDRLGNITYFGSLTQYDYTTRHSGCGSQPAHAQPHAVKQIGSNYYCYDANGNMTRRVEGGVTYQQSFNVENELTSVVVSGQTTSFTYDAAGIRVKTVKPNGVVIDHPFPSYEVENPTATTPIRRSAYSIAGQTIATRVSGDPVSGNNGLTYFYNDHLGSNTALRKPDGSRVSTYYLPFGGYRPGSAPTQTITDRDFTGQRENMELGLLYYQARFYVPAIGRFASADTIVPDPTNPQNFNRYSYVLNSPINYMDHDGHKQERALVVGGGDVSNVSFGGLSLIQQALYAGMTFSAIQFAYQHPEVMWAIHDAISMSADTDTDIELGDTLDDLYTEENLETITRHLGERLGALGEEWAKHNDAMLERQRAIMNGEIELTDYDIAWMEHELIESGLMDADESLDASTAHQKTLELQGLENWDIWPDEIYWKYRDSLGNELWDEAINNR